MSVQKKLYHRYFNNEDKPVINENVTSSHWKGYSENISVTQKIKNGKEEFILKGYGFGENEKKGLIKQLFADLGVFIYRRILKLSGLNENVIRAKKIIKRMGLSFSLDAFRQVCTINLINKKMTSTWQPERVIIIGDGYGILSALIHDWYPLAKIYLIDLGPMLFFQSFYLSKAFPETRQSLIDTDSFTEESFNLCSADQIGKLNMNKVDLAINIASMQEMSKEMITQYFSLLRELKTQNFYCCNRVEKKMPGGEVSRISEYPWSNDDKFIIDELCPWHTWFLGRGDTPNVKIMGIRVPFVHQYDGPHWHRLAILSN